MQSQSDGTGHLHKPQWENGMRVQVDEQDHLTLIEISYSPSFWGKAMTFVAQHD